MKRRKERNKEKKRKENKKHNDIFVYINLVLWAFISPFGVCLLSLSIVEGLWEISMRSFTPWVTIVMHLEYWEIMWEFYEILHFLDHCWYILWVLEMNNLLLGSLDYCPIHHPIISDMTFLCCIDMSWSSFFLFSLRLSMFSYHLFVDFCSIFYSFLTSVHVLDLIPLLE